MREAEQIIRDIPKGLIAWYQFNMDDSVLYIGNKDDVLAELLFQRQCEGNVESVSVYTWDVVAGNSNHEKKYDVIISVEDIEKVCNPTQFLACIKQCLAPNGKLLIGANNRLGIRYFCGDRDPYTNRNFDGIENYRRFSVNKEDYLPGKMYDKNSLDKMLQEAGFEHRLFYSVFSDLKSPTFLYAEDYIPNEELSVRSFPMYNYPETVFLEEEFLYTDLINNGLFHTMANAYLIECSLTEKSKIERRVNHVTSSLDRGKGNALYTIIYNDGTVEKKAVYEEGVARLEQLYCNGECLKKRGIAIIDAQITKGSYSMPYIDAETALSYLRRIALENRDRFVSLMDKFYELIKKSSELCEKKDGKGTILVLKKGYLDLVPLNCFVIKGEFVFYDQEFILENCPLGVIVLRLVDQVYRGNYELECLFPKKFFYDRYSLTERIDEYRYLVNQFTDSLRNVEELKAYYDKRYRSLEIVNANRQRMNYSEQEYNRLFVDVFHDVGDKKIILFGSGSYAKRFIAMYGKDYPIYAIVDNNVDRHGRYIGGVQIMSPDILCDMDKNSFKVLICIKSYLSVVSQLEKMGISDYGIFDSSRSYARPMKFEIKEPVNHITKRYKVGYVAGVFDLFHIGHVLLLQKAKEQCEYLIVGVVPDEDVYRQKNKHPIIPCEDRVAVLQACKYVDRVEALPVGFGGIRDAHKMYQFDVLFSGDDHSNDQIWVANKEYLNKHGADIVFFDYTEKTSSTKIREQLIEADESAKTLESE